MFCGGQEGSEMILSHKGPYCRDVPCHALPRSGGSVPCQISKTPAARQRRLPCGPLYCSMKVTLWNSKAVPSAFGSSMVAGTYSANRSIRNQHQQTFLDRRKLSRFFSGTIGAPPSTLPTEASVTNTKNILRQGETPAIFSWDYLSTSMYSA